MEVATCNEFFIQLPACWQYKSSKYASHYNTSLSSTKCYFFF